MISFRLDIADAHAHLYRVTLRIPRPAARQRLSLPVWVPGLYLILDTPRNLMSFEARQSGRRTRAPLKRLDKATWEVSCTGTATLVVEYTVYAFDLTPRSAFLDGQRGFFNGTAVFLQVDGRESETQRLELGPLPEGWRATSAMRARRVDETGVGVYESADYDELVDHPFTLGRHWHGHFTAGGVPHEIVLIDAHDDVDGDRLAADVRAMCEATIALWHPAGPPPFDRYVFMFTAIDEGFHGLEHRASTMMGTLRRDLPRRGQSGMAEGYANVLSLFSHEYFHAWNVKRLRPAQFTAYDYGRENYTDLLWFFEGFTSYYDELMLLRSGLLDPARYVRSLARHVNRLQETTGQGVQTLAEASFESWLRTHRPDENTPNASVSYYTKGALVALLLDLTLRVESRSLDEVMRLLWNRSGGGAIAEADIRQALNDVAGRSMDDLLDAWVHGRSELPLRETLQAWGIRWRMDTPSARQRLGLRVSDNMIAPKVTHVLRHGDGERAGFSPGDEILAVDGWRMRRLDDAPQLALPGNSSEVLVARDRRLLTLTVVSTGERACGSVALFLDNADAEVARRRDEWLSTAKQA